MTGIPDLESSKNTLISTFAITGSDGTNVDLRPAVAAFNYYENILSATITANAVFADAGTSKLKSNETQTNLLTGLPVRGGESVQIVMEDNKKNKLKLIGDNILHVNAIDSGILNTNSSGYKLDFVTQEFLINEQTKLEKRYGGKISDSIEKILKELGVKSYDIEETSNVYEFIANEHSPLYLLDWLSSKSIPTNVTPGTGAGFFFFQTSEGYKFKSVDGLLDISGKKIRKYRYSNTPGSVVDNTPGNYTRILDHSIDQNTNVQAKMQVGSYNSRILVFCPYTFKVDTIINSAIDGSISKGPQQALPTSQKQVNNVKTAGKKLDAISSKFLEKPTRFMSVIKDVGTLPKGSTAIEQLKNWKNKKEETNDKIEYTLAQSIMRFNQLFSNKISITVAGDFSLHAGDLLYCEFPALAQGDVNSVNKETSGYYLISGLCHSVGGNEFFTYLDLVRDSVGKKTY
jgi:hypothetical protein